MDFLDVSSAANIYQPASTAALPQTQAKNGAVHACAHLFISVIAEVVCLCLNPAALVLLTLPGLRWRTLVLTSSRELDVIYTLSQSAYQTLDVTPDGGRESKARLSMKVLRQRVIKPLSYKATTLSALGLSRPVSKVKAVGWTRCSAIASTDTRMRTPMEPGTHWIPRQASVRPLGNHDRTTANVSCLMHPCHESLCGRNEHGFE